VIKKVFRDLGFTDFDDPLSSSYRTWQYLVQYRESDFNFVNRLMQQEGIYYYFIHEDNKRTLILTDSYSGNLPAKGYETVPFLPPDPSSEGDRDDPARAESSVGRRH